MKKEVKRLSVMMLSVVFCLGIMAGCSKKQEAQEPDLVEDDYYEDDYYEEEPYDEEEYAEEQDTSSESAEFAVGKWYTDDYDVDDNWAGSYVIELKEDGTATCEGYRNKDAGTYETTGSDKVLITFDKCELDEAGEGWKPVTGFTYTIEMVVDGDDAKIKIDAPDVISNLEDGIVHRKSDKAEDSDSPVGKWYTEDYDEDDNWANSYVIELKEDGTATCSGYRNRDTGTYESVRAGKVRITFDFCETDEPDAGWVAAEGYSYTIDMTIDGDDALIKIDAPDAISNLEDGIVHRNKADDSDDKDGSDRSSKSRSKGKAKTGKKIEFTTTDFDGKKITSEELFAEHEVTMVNVWATWCFWCVDEMPELNKINKRLAKKDCAIVGLLGDIDDDDTLEEAEQILKDNNVTYLNILPWKGAVEEDFNMDEGWPTSFFVDRDGYIIGDPIVGASTDEYEKRIDEILKSR